MFFQQLVNAITIGGVYALVGVGYTLVFGVLGLVNFAHGSIYTWGAFLAFTLIMYLGIPFGWAMVLSMVLMAIIGIVIERFGYYPIRNSPIMNQIVSVLAISIILDNMAMLIWGTTSKAFPPINISDVWTIKNVKISILQLIIIGSAFFLMLFLYILVYKTKVGTAMRATSLDADTSKLMGINVNKIRLLTFTLSCALAAAAGSLVGQYYHSVIFNMGYGVVIKAFVVAILGGMGNVIGAMIGGLLVGIIECFGAAYISSGWKDAFVYIILVLILLLKPTGLLGAYEQKV